MSRGVVLAIEFRLIQIPIDMLRHSVPLKFIERLLRLDTRRLDEFPNGGCPTRCRPRTPPAHWPPRRFPTSRTVPGPVDRQAPEQPPPPISRERRAAFRMARPGPTSSIRSGRARPTPPPTAHRDSPAGARPGSRQYMNPLGPAGHLLQPGRYAGEIDLHLVGKQGAHRLRIALVWHVLHPHAGRRANNSPGGAPCPLPKRHRRTCPAVPWPAR